jgi:hypothetical protein
MEALSSSETSVLTRATLHNIPEDAILHSHRRENLKYYIFKQNFVSLYEGYFFNLEASSNDESLFEKLDVLVSCNVTDLWESKSKSLDNLNLLPQSLHLIRLYSMSP